MYILPIHDDGPWGNINCTPPLFPHPTSYFPRNFQAGCKIMLQSCQLKQGFFCCIFFEYYFLLYISQGLFFAVYVFLKWSLLVLRLVSSIFQIVHFLVHSNFDLLALFAGKKVAQMTTQMTECYHLRQHFGCVGISLYHKRDKSKSCSSLSDNTPYQKILKCW